MKIFHLSGTGIKKPRKKGIVEDNTDYFAVGDHTWHAFDNTISIEIIFWEHEADATNVKLQNAARHVVVNINGHVDSVRADIEAEALEWNNKTTTSGDKITLKNATFVADV